MVEFDPPSVMELRWEDDETLRLEVAPRGSGCVLTLINRFDEIGKAARDARRLARVPRRARGAPRRHAARLGGALAGRPPGLRRALRPRGGHDRPTNLKGPGPFRLRMPLAPDRAVTVANWRHCASRAASCAASTPSGVIARAARGPTAVARRQDDWRARSSEPLAPVPPPPLAALVLRLGLVGRLLVAADRVLELLEADDADAGAEAAVAAVLLDVAAPGAAAAAAVVAAAAAAATAAAATAAAAAAPAAVPAAALAAATAATPATAAPAVVAIGGPRVHDRLDVTDRRRREAHPRGEGRVAGLDALGLLGADRRPLHRLAVVAPLGLQRLEHGLGAADALDRGREPRLRAGGPGRRRGRSLRRRRARRRPAACSSPSATGWASAPSLGLDRSRLVGAAPRRPRARPAPACAAR